MGHQVDVTARLVALAGGNSRAWDELMPVVYDELKLVAHRHLSKERSGHTLNTTALVHEAYLKLVNGARVQLRDRAHFFALASRAMRHILIDYARTRKREKRGGGIAPVTLDDDAHIPVDQIEDLIDLGDALTELEAVNERQCRVVEYRFFGGMSVEETAEVLGVSRGSVKRDWRIARAWLNHELGEKPSDDELQP